MFSNIGPWQLLIVLVIVVMVFGTKKLRTLGSDLGSAVKGFKKAMNADEAEASKIEQKPQQEEDENASKAVDKQKENV